MITVYIIVQLHSHRCCLQGSNSTLGGCRATHFNYSHSRDSWEESLQFTV